MNYFNNYFGVSGSNSNATTPAAPVITPSVRASGRRGFVSSMLVTITSENGLPILYTLDGTIPSLNGPQVEVYSGPFRLNVNTTVTAIVIDSGLPSAVAVATYIKCAPGALASI